MSFASERPVPVQAGESGPVNRGGMDDDPTRWLFDPTTTRELVLARRPPGNSPVDCVVSDLVWGDVVRLLRWATANTPSTAGLETGIWWRLAATCAELRLRLPGLSAEIAEPWDADGPAAIPPGLSPGARIEYLAGRLTAHLRSPEPVPLRTLAAEIDALGEAAISALAERAVSCGAAVS